jgi:hypothetical protein
MARSHRRRRLREAPLRKLRAAIRKEIQMVARNAGVVVSKADEDRLSGELTRLADPYLVAGRDALIPAQRGDLRLKLVASWVRGATPTVRARLEMAAQFAALPDSQPESGRYPLGYNPAPVSYGEALRAFLSQRRHTRPHQGGSTV